MQARLQGLGGSDIPHFTLSCGRRPKRSGTNRLPWRGGSGSRAPRF